MSCVMCPQRSHRSLANRHKIAFLSQMRPQRVLPHHVRIDIHQKQHTCVARSDGGQQEIGDRSFRTEALCLKAVAVSALACLSVYPAAADIQTVTASQAIDSARPIAAQTVHKGRVWLLLGGGSALLFGSTIVVENNETFFPAIARANKAMQRSRETREEEAGKLAAVQLERDQNELLVSSVEEQLRDTARLRSLTDTELSGGNVLTASEPVKGDRLSTRQDE